MELIGDGFVEFVFLSGLGHGCCCDSIDIDVVRKSEAAELLLGRQGSWSYSFYLDLFSWRTESNSGYTQDC